MRTVPAGPHPPAGKWRELSPESAQRAAWAWRALVDLYLDVGRGGVVKVRDQPGRFASLAALWPLSQVIAAALHVSRLTGDTTLVGPLFGALDRHRLRRGDGYLPYPGQGPLYFDDNAWVGLDQVQAALLGDPGTGADARRTLGVVAAGQGPDGCIRWRDVPGSPVNTCATAPTLQLTSGWPGTSRRARSATASLPSPWDSTGDSQIVFDERTGSTPTTSSPTGAWTTRSGPTTRGPRWAPTCCGGA